MTSVLRHSVAVLAIALHLFSSAAVEYAHHDGHSTGSSSLPAFLSHDCGPHERHLPIEWKGVCAVCAYAFSLAAAAVAGQFASDLPAARAFPEIQGAHRTDCSDLFHSGKRGPPAA